MMEKSELKCCIKSGKTASWLQAMMSPMSHFCLKSQRNGYYECFVCTYTTVNLDTLDIFWHFTFPIFIISFKLETVKLQDLSNGIIYGLVQFSSHRKNVHCIRSCMAVDYFVRRFLIFIFRVTNTVNLSSTVLSVICLQSCIRSSV